MPTTKPTFCRICEAHCPLLADIDDQGKVVKLRPHKEHPVAKGFACHKGLSFLQVHNDPDRLNTPQRRKNARAEDVGDFETISWDTALNEIGEKIKSLQEKYGPDCVAVYSGNPVGFNSRALILSAKFNHLLGAKYSFSANTQDLANKYAASQYVFGSHSFTIPDLEHTDFFVCFGGNPKISKGTVISMQHPMQVLKAIKHRGGEILFVNPRKIESSNADTGDVLLIKPDTDVYLMAALLHELDKLSAWRESTISAQGKNVDALRKFVAQYPAERVSNVTGIPTNAILALAKKIASKKSVAFYMGTGINQGRQGTLGFWLLNMLTFVTGNFAARGGSYRPAGNRGKVIDPGPPIDTVLGPIHAIWGGMPGNLFADFIQHESRPIRALINISGNPLLTMAGEDRLREAFKSLDLIVSIDIYRSDTAEMSDYVLPASDWLERADINFLSLGLQQEPFVQYADAMEEPTAQRKNDYWILARLIEAVGKSAVRAGDEEGWGFTNKILGAYELSIDDLRHAEHQMAYVPERDDRTASYADVVRNKDGKVDCCPAAFAESLAQCESIFNEIDADRGDALQLISLRTNYMHNSWLSNMPQMRHGRNALNPLHIHPDDAAKRGLENGQTVTAFNANGEIQTKLLFDTNLREGVVAMTHGYGQRHAPSLSLASGIPGTNPNRLLPTGPGSYEKLSGMSWMNGVGIDVRAT